MDASVKFCRGEQRRYLTWYDDVRHGGILRGILRGKLVDARLEIVRHGLVPCLSSFPEVLKDDFELYHERSEQSNGIENGGNNAEQLSKCLRRIDCFRRWSCERVIRKTKVWPRTFVVFWMISLSSSGRAVRAAGLFETNLERRNSPCWRIVRRLGVRRWAASAVAKDIKKSSMLKLWKLLHKLRESGRIGRQGNGVERKWRSRASSWRKKTNVSILANDAIF